MKNIDESVSLRREMVRLGRAMHARGLISGGDGNMSARLGRNLLLVTPSGVHKGFLETADLLECDLEGRVVSGRGRLTSEIRMHLLVYQERPETEAVVHAHPPLVTALSLVGHDFSVPLLPELVILAGAIPTAPYATPGTPEVPASIRPFLPEHKLIILERHGCLCLGQSLMEAYGLLEQAEHLAKVVLAARAAGSAKPLSPDQVRALLDVKGAGRP